MWRPPALSCNPKIVSYILKCAFQSVSRVSKKLVFVAYLLVSTARQGESGLGLEAQQATVEAFAKAQGRPILATYECALRRIG
jgi:hypothetical protein